MLRTTIDFMSDEKDKNLIDFIAATVEAMRDRIDNQMATKGDLAALKEQMATKRELAELKDLVATKSDITRVEANLATLKEQVAMKNDVARVEASLDTKTTAIRGDIGQVQVRLDSIDRPQTTRVGRDRH
jgi:translation initiation factor 6 (eIF-6)